jgi:hypothetical protein
MVGRWSEGAPPLAGASLTWAHDETAKTTTKSEKRYLFTSASTSLQTFTMTQGGLIQAEIRALLASAQSS